MICGFLDITPISIGYITRRYPINLSIPIFSDGRRWCSSPNNFCDRANSLYAPIFGDDTDIGLFVVFSYCHANPIFFR